MSHETASVSSAHAGRRFPRLALAVLGLLLGLVLAEGGTRGVLLAKSRPYSADGVLREMRSILTGMTTSLPTEQAEVSERERLRRERTYNVLHPYTGFSTPYSISRADHILGGEDPQEDLFDVFLFGGSFAALLDTHIREELQRDLEALPELQGRPVRIRRYADGGLKQPQHLLSLCYHLSLGARPDLVVNLDGYNEIHLTGINAKRGERISWPSVGHWTFLTEGGRPDETTLEHLVLGRNLQDQARELVRSTETLGLELSALLGPRRLGELQRLQRRWSANQTALVEHLRQAADGRRRAKQDKNPQQLGAPPPPDHAPLAYLEESVRLWAQSSRQMHALCQGAGIPYLHLLQPTLHDPGTKPLTPEEIDKGQAEGGFDERVEAGYAGLRTAGQELVADGVDFVDLTGIFREETGTLYYDRCHVNRQGSALVAKRLVELVEQRMDKQ